MAAAETAIKDTALALPGLAVRWFWQENSHKVMEDAIFRKAQSGTNQFHW
jgi:hypothetical protein